MSNRTSRVIGRVVGALGVVAALAAALGLLALTQVGRTTDTPPVAPQARVEVADIVPPSTTLPTGPTTAGAPQQVGRPTRLVVPAIGVDEPLEGRGLAPDGALDTPDFGDVAWYSPGPRPGEAGGAVVVAHVHGPDGPDVFWDLATLEPGDVVRVERTDGVATFVVDAVEDVAKEDLPYERIWPATDVPLLRLITCGGERLPQGGYPDNTIVYAHLIR